MASPREALAAKCKIDTVEFWAKTASGGFRRNLAGHGGIGIEGQRFEDLGEDARKETITAELFEDEYLDLLSVYSAGKRVSFTHPLFGVKQIRIESYQYQANENDMVDVTIVVVEDGERKQDFDFAFLNLGAEATRWAGFVNDFSLEIEQITLDGFDPSEYLDTTISLTFFDSINAFSSIIDVALEAEAAVDELAAAYSDFAATADDFVNELEDSLSAFSPLTDLVYESIAIAQDVVRSVSVLDNAPWNNFLVQAPVLIGDIALDFLGADNEDNIDLLLEYNPQLIDVGIISPGFELVVPVR
jgi:hypothetical protein